MHRHLTTRFKRMALLLGDAYDILGDDYVFWYDCVSGLVAKIIEQVFIDTGGVSSVSVVLFLLGGTAVYQVAFILLEVAP